MRRIKENFITVGVYVDDLVIIRSNTKTISKFKQAMAMKFDMTNLGLLTYYLGIKVHQKEKDITVTQEGYVKKVLKYASMFNCNPTLIPMDSNVKFFKGSISIVAYSDNNHNIDEDCGRCITSHFLPE